MQDLVARAMRVCDGCKAIYLPQRSNARFCSRACREIPAKARWCPVRYGTCVTCVRPFVVRPAAKGLRKTCGRPECVSEHRRQLANARKRNREHARRAGVSDITNAQEIAMRKRARKCAMAGCGVRLTDRAGQPNSKHLDHIVPLNQGGTHTHGNVRIICARCNLTRPKDGRDFAGQLTLWAVIPGVAARKGRQRA